MTRQWQTEREHGNRFLLGLLAWVALHLGRKTIFVLLCPIVFHYFLVAKKARQASRLFLTRALNRAPRWWEIYYHFLTFAVVSIDRIYFLSHRETIFDVHLHGTELFSQYKTRGCFLLTAHIGSIDALRVMGLGERRKMLPVRILLDIKHNPNALNLIQALDPELASRVIDASTPAPELALLLSEAIENQQLIGIMADRCVQGDRVTSLDFFGQIAQFPQGVWQLAALLQVPVILCVGLYSGGNRYDLHFELLSEKLGATRKERQAAIDVAMLSYVERLTHFAQNNPYNWFNFYDFWNDDTTQHH
jgi:predicted LPLAT superfamily acyltransferase